MGQARWTPEGVRPGHTCFPRSQRTCCRHARWLSPGQRSSRSGLEFAAWSPTRSHTGWGVPRTLTHDGGAEGNVWTGSALATEEMVSSPLPRVPKVVCVQPSWAMLFSCSFCPLSFPWSFFFRLPLPRDGSRAVTDGAA